MVAAKQDHSRVLVTKFHQNRSTLKGRSAGQSGAANKTAQNKIDKYAKFASTHIFYPFAVETAGTWHHMAIQLTQEIGRRITSRRTPGKQHSSSNVYPLLFKGEMQSPSTTQWSPYETPLQPF